MSASPKPESTTVATRTRTAMAERIDASVAERREHNELVAAIRGTQWGKDTTPQMARAVAHYCRENGLDPVRHVEILGGRIYLTAEFYDERGATLVRAGVVKPEQPDFIHADERLTKMAAAGNAWAIGEQERREQLRIEHAVPESAKAAVIQKFVLSTGAVVFGVNWCGQSGKSDPVGNAEPTKTALTRARRRAWKQIADVIPDYGTVVHKAEATARIASEALPVSIIEPDRPVRALSSGPADDPYDIGRVPVAPGSVNDHAEADRGARDPEYQDDSDIAD